MASVYELAILVLFLTGVPQAQCECGSPFTNATANLLPIEEGTPLFMRSTNNGKLYSVGNGEDSYFILHLYGTPYEMGFAQGTLLREEATTMINRTWQYMEEQIVGSPKKLKFLDWFLDDVATFGLDAALDLELLVTKEHTPQAFFDECRGLAAATEWGHLHTKTGVWSITLSKPRYFNMVAAGSSGHIEIPCLERILYIHLIGELTRGSCSMMGAWGSSVQKLGSLIQLRALDWAVDGPFKDFPQVTVYHPSNTTYGNTWANFGWTGWLGSITGMNSHKVAISEIGVAFPDRSFGRESRFGIPFTNLLRDLLQYDTTLDQAITRIQTAKRTCDLILGVGDGKDQSFRGIQYSASKANFFDDTNLEPQASWHPRINNVVYYGMDWLCPGYSQVLARQIQKHYGHINATIVIRDMVSIAQTGNLQVAVYDLTENIAYLANARGTYEGGPENAYERELKLSTQGWFLMEQLKEKMTSFD